jgi:DNA helicase-2/ATP-dependent DNA helicase PcrA
LDRAAFLCRARQTYFQGADVVYILDDILETIDMRALLTRTYRAATEATDRWRNVEELQRVARTARITEAADPLQALLDEAGVGDDPPDVTPDPDVVMLMTIHAAKGQEFPLVVMVGLDEQTLPHYLSETDLAQQEERRLCFVGWTRARKWLYLFCSSAAQPSRFLTEAGLAVPVEPATT